jgi:hypothetical protein
LLHCANSSDLDEETVTEEITDAERELRFDGLENYEVWELLNSHSEEMADDDLLLLDQQRALEEGDAEEQDNMQLKKFTLKEFEGNFRVVEVVKQKIMDADPDLDQNMQIC